MRIHIIVLLIAEETILLTPEIGMVSRIGWSSTVGEELEMSLQRGETMLTNQGENKSKLANSTAKIVYFLFQALLLKENLAQRRIAGKINILFFKLVLHLR